MIFLRHRDAILRYALRFLALVAAGVIILVVVFVTGEAAGVATNGDHPFQSRNLLLDEAWNPSAHQFNITPLIVGTLLVTFGSTLVCAPVGIGCALFINFYAPAGIQWVVRQLVDVLAGIPSVVYGLWGLSVLVPLIASVSPLEQGQSLLAGVLILSFMTIPMVVVASDTALKAVPDEQIQAASALGLGKRTIAWAIAFRHAKMGIMSGIILQVARAVGETMAVLMVCGNIVQNPSSIFSPIRTLTANIALEMGYADDHHRAVLFLTGLISLAIVAFLMVAANFFVGRRLQSKGSRTCR